MIYSNSVKRLLGLLAESTDDALVIAGGSVLQHHLGISASSGTSDIDIYIHLRPQSLQDFRWYGTRPTIGLHHPRHNNSIELLHDALDTLKAEHGIDYSDYKCWNTRPYDDPDRYGQYNWLRVHLGIVTFIMLRLHPEDDLQESAKSAELQFMFINHYPASQDEDWFRLIVSEFDIDACQVFIRPTSTAYLDRDYVVEALNPSIFQQIEARKMTFTFKRCQPYDVAYKRIRKYQDRGFKLVALRCDALLSQSWVDCLLESAKAKLNLCVLWGYMFQRNFINYPGALDIAQTHIAPLLSPPPSLEVTVGQLYREMLLARAREREHEIAPYMLGNDHGREEDDSSLPHFLENQDDSSAEQDGGGSDDEHQGGDLDRRTEHWHGLEW